MSHHFLFVGIPDRGHLFPNLSVVSELIRRGHRVTFLTGESMAEVIEPSGATLLPYESRYEQVDVLGATNADPAAMPLTLTEDSGAMVRAALAGLADDVPDMIVGDSVTPLAWRILGEKWQRPAVQSSVVFVSNEHWSFVQSMIEDGKITSPPDMSAVFAAMAQVVAASGIQKPPTAFLQPSADEFTLVYLPREFQFAGNTFSPEQFAFVGPSMEDRPFLGTWQPPATDRPVVLVSLGTTFSGNPDFFRDAAAAFADEPWHVVMTVGGGFDPAELGPLPSNVEVHRWLPHLEVLARARVFVTHGGVGSVMESLYTGTPMVAVPLSPVDEPTAKRIVELGVGRSITPDALSATTLRAAVAEVAASADIQANTELMRKYVRESGGAKEAADLLEKFLAE